MTAVDDRLNNQLDRAGDMVLEAKRALRQDLRTHIAAAKDRIDQLFDELLADADAKAADLIDDFNIQLIVANDVQTRAVWRYESTIMELVHELTSADFELTSAAFDPCGFDPRGYFVYLLWGDDPDTPIYVGQSRNILSRLGSHMKDEKKRDMTRRLQLIRCPDETTMDNMERVLIRKHQPPLNVTWCGRPVD
ncbi:MAG: Excinuclease subunit-like protein [Mycobacterium sp.]|nr:Excinuclease subunit-like protein [Mycobacterium sp.]